MPWMTNRSDLQDRKRKRNPFVIPYPDLQQPVNATGRLMPGGMFGDPMQMAPATATPLASPWLGNRMGGQTAQPQLQALRDLQSRTAAVNTSGAMTQSPAKQAVFQPVSPWGAPASTRAHSAAMAGGIPAERPFVPPDPTPWQPGLNYQSGPLADAGQAALERQRQQQLADQMQQQEAANARNVMWSNNAIDKPVEEQFRGPIGGSNWNQYVGRKLAALAAAKTGNLGAYNQVNPGPWQGYMSPGDRLPGPDGAALDANAPPRKGQELLDAYFASGRGDRDKWEAYQDRRKPKLAPMEERQQAVTDRARARKGLASSLDNSIAMALRKGQELKPDQKQYLAGRMGMGDAYMQNQAAQQAFQAQQAQSVWTNQLNAATQMAMSEDKDTAAQGRKLAEKLVQNPPGSGATPFSGETVAEPARPSFEEAQRKLADLPAIIVDRYGNKPTATGIMQRWESKIDKDLKAGKTDPIDNEEFEALQEVSRQILTVQSGKLSDDEQMFLRGVVAAASPLDLSRRMQEWHNQKKKRREQVERNTAGTTPWLTQGI